MRSDVSTTTVYNGNADEVDDGLEQRRRRSYSIGSDAVWCRPMKKIDFPTNSLNQPPASSDFLSANDVATVLRISRRHLARLRSQGGGPPYVRLGPKMLRYSRAALEAWAASRTFPHLAAEAAAKGATS